MYLRDNSNLNVTNSVFWGNGDEQIYFRDSGDDVSLAINQIINTNITGKSIYELAGPRIYSYKEFFNHISNFLNKTTVLVPVPMGLMKPMINIAEKTPISPLTSEQLMLFEKNNIAVNVDKSLENLDINPQDTLQVLKNIVVN